MIRSWKAAYGESLNGDQQAAVAATGWLEHAPSSWQHLLIRTLPPQDRLSVFQSCNWLARRVLESASVSTLSLTGKAPADIVSKRQHVLTQLLAGSCHNLKVVLSQPGAKPFPHALSSAITALEFFCTALGRDSTDHSYSWGAVSRLQHLKFVLSAGVDDVSRLCDALEAGQLQQLQKFHLYQQRIKDTALLQRLACAFSAQLTHLGTSSTGLLEQVSYLTALQSLDLHGCTLSSNTLEKLCIHPTLQVVRLRDCKVEGDHSQQLCHWQALVLWDVELKLLAALPLAGLQEIRFVGDVREPKDHIDTSALRYAIKEHANSIVCEPGDALDGTIQFNLNALHAELVELVRFLRVPCKVAVWGAVQEAGLVQALWQALPAVVHSVEFGTLPPGHLDQGIDWLQLWDGLPGSVKRIDLCGCWMSAGELVEVLSAVPAHVQVLGLSHWDVSVRASWDDDALCAVVPRHTCLEID